MAPLIAEKTYPVQVGNKAGRKALITTSFHLKLGNRTIKEVDHLKVLALKVHRTITGTNSTSNNKKTDDCDTLVDAKGSM